MFAAKSDGHIDAKERAAIEHQLRESGVEEQGRVFIEKAIEQPLDPQRLAQGVRNEEEALEVYFLSCAAIDIDHFMERSYLNALGDALKNSSGCSGRYRAGLAAAKTGATRLITCH